MLNALWKLDMGRKGESLPSGSFQSHREWGPKTEVKIDHKPCPGGESQKQESPARELAKATSQRGSCASPALVTWWREGGMQPHRGALES